METFKSISLDKCKYNYSTLKYFIEKAFEIDVLEVRVIINGRAFKANRDLHIVGGTTTGIYNFVLFKTEETDCWNISIFSLNGKRHLISKETMSLIYPVKNSDYSYRRTVELITNSIVNDKIGRGKFYTNSMFDEIDSDIYGYPLTGAMLVERDNAIVSDYADYLSKEYGRTAEYQSEILDGKNISDDKKLELMLSKMGIDGSMGSELSVIDRNLKRLDKMVATSSGVNITDGVSFEFSSDKMKFNPNLN